MLTWTVVALALAGANDPWADAIRESVQRRDRAPHRLYLHVRDLERGWQFGHRADEPTYLASCVKVAILIEVFRQRKMGRLTDDEQLAYLEEDVRDGAPRLNRHPLGTRFPLSTLLDWMVRSSDNGASDLLLQRVGIANVQRGLQELGIGGFGPITTMLDVRRGVYAELDPKAAKLPPEMVRSIRWTEIWQPQLDKLAQAVGRPAGTFHKDDAFRAYEAYYRRGINSAPMRTMSGIFARLAQYDLLGPQADRRMLELLSHPRTSLKRIRGRLPPGTRVAHKTGSQYQRVCDVGVIDMPEGAPLVVAACVSGGDVAGAEAAIAGVAGAAYRSSRRWRGSMEAVAER